MIKLLHISSHYGGGVGSVTKAWTTSDKKNIHKLTFLNDIPENYKENHELFNVDMVKDYDIVIVHVWNHPALFEFLTTVKLPPCRLIGWSHMAGNNPPYILFDKLKNYFDEFYYTSPVSGLDREYVWSTCDVSSLLSVKKKPHKGFNIGYVGTLDFCKLHPDFISICKEIDIPDAKFIVVGGGCDSETLKNQSMGLNIEFTGQVKDIKPYLSIFDVFLYPLNRNHEGTCEQVLGESLAVGIPVIVINNEAEGYIIEDGITGFVCNNTNEIINIIDDLYHKKISLDEKKIKSSAKKIYSLEKKIKRWNNVFKKTIKKEKKSRKWNIENYNIFIESLGTGRERDAFESYIKYDSLGNHYDLHEFAIPKVKKIINSNNQWKSKNKGSILQYADYFPSDKYLKKWLKLL